MIQTVEEYRRAKCCQVCGHRTKTIAGIGIHIASLHGPMREYYARFIRHPCRQCGGQVGFRFDASYTFNLDFCGAVCAGRFNRSNYRGAEAKGYVSNKGYRMVEVTKFPGHESMLRQMAQNNGQISEHRGVMAVTLGRPLLPHETVHHKDGDRLNNIPENLEIWHGRHTPGQRLADIVCPHCHKTYA